MSENLVEVTRGEIVECIHRGDIAVCDINGNLHASAGSPDKISYLRSAAKPIQALPVFTSGAFDRYRFNQSEVAVICSSHYAEEFHLQAISSILDKIGLAAEHILGGIVTSLNPKYALELAWKNIELTPLFSDCSGKHAGMLSVCTHKGFDIATYLSPDHPCQQEILKTLAEMCSVPEPDILIGIDGCNAPVHAMPLKNIAQGFARLANWQGAPPAYRQGTDIIFHAMNAHPEMVSGTGGFCTELMRRSNGKLTGKIGAEGVYCIGVKDRNLGIAIKIESGNMAMLPPVAVGVLEQLDLIDPNELESLNNYRIMDNTNDLGIKVGNIRPAFTLQFY